ncbi:MAG TPA: poly-gamma-glutamate hydrolase family protein [Acidimicrobiales bacterium]
MSLGELLALPGVEERCVLAGPVGFLAFHGGLEGGTEVVAAAAAGASGASLYTVVQPPTIRWHLPSHVVGAGASPALLRFLDHVETAIAIHGYGRPGRPRDILVGGGNRRLARRLGAVLRRRLTGYNVLDDLDELPREMRGLHPDNPVNRCRGGGVQLELPPLARGASGRWIDANTGCVPLPDLIGALTEVAGAGQSTSNVPPTRQ